MKKLLKYITLPLRLMRPGTFIFYYRQLSLLIRNRNGLKLKTLQLIAESKVILHIDHDSMISLGAKVCLRNNVEMGAYSGAQIRIGDNFFANRNCSIISRFGITIGNDCMLASNVCIYDHNHVFSRMDRPFSSQGYSGAPVRLGNNVWIGANSFIGAGVELGDNVVIGAGTVVTKSIPANSIVFGKIQLMIRPLAGATDASTVDLQ